MKLRDGESLRRLLMRRPKQLEQLVQDRLVVYRHRLDELNY